MSKSAGLATLDPRQGAAADPESHFARFTPEQKAHPDSSHNFVFLPRIAGTED